MMDTKIKGANIGARLDRLPNSGWHVKMWLVTAFALLVCWSNGIGGSVQNILLNELHWLKEGTTLLAMWGTAYTAGQLFGALVGGPIGDKIGRKKSILLYEVIHIIAMIGGAISPNIYVLYVFRLIQGLDWSIAGSIVCRIYRVCSGKKQGVWSSRNFYRKLAHPICNGIAFLIVTTGISYNMNWRIQYMIPSVLSIIASLLIAKKFPESPRWLESQGRVEEADAIMTKIEKEIEASTGKPLPPVMEEPKQVKQLPYSALFKGKLLQRTIVGSLVLIGMNTIQYTLMTWMPSLLRSLGYDTSQSQFMTMFGLFGAPFGIFIASLIMDKIPRRVMGVILLAVMAVLESSQDSDNDDSIDCINLFLNTQSTCTYVMLLLYMFRNGQHLQKCLVRDFVMQWACK
ncbi:MAG: MFS transporter [[Clostridium] nexile]